MNVLKVCIRPTCEEIAHNCDKKEKRCRNCGMILVEITQKQYEKKFKNHYFQINYETDERYMPPQKEIDLFNQ